MADFLDLESVNEVEAPICTSSFLFGCELNSSARSYTFKVSEEDDSDHILALNTVCLSEGAKDECNIVEIVGRDYQNQEIAVPVANLKLSCQPWFTERISQMMSSVKRKRILVRRMSLAKRKSSLRSSQPRSNGSLSPEDFSLPRNAVLRRFWISWKVWSYCLFG
ncbi:nucleoplasmin-3 isoform X2 [Hemicordylus capensis]|uniref:nucleoplasmin-3 isoform X2 n=1 Tax=Hemicordylus capensis TaxID=884348 RepID=UPI002303FC80|nr:nucleoplasmin-3 isoform X2 [Hemicordylus capensis]